MLNWDELPKQPLSSQSCMLRIRSRCTPRRWSSARSCGERRQYRGTPSLMVGEHPFKDPRLIADSNRKEQDFR
jgi:hypothetical protein